MPERDPAEPGAPPTPARSAEGADIDAGHHMGRILDDAAQLRRLILVVDTPGHLSRLSLYQALDDQIGRWGRRHGDVGACIDLSNHPVLPAQTIIGSLVQTWDDLAEGLPQALIAANILFVLGLEQMLKDTRHRLAAFLEARARHQVVIVLTSQAAQVCELTMRDTPVHLDRSLACESDLQIVARAVSLTAIAAARQATRRHDADRTLPRDGARGGT